MSPRFTCPLAIALLFTVDLTGLTAATTPTRDPAVNSKESARDPRTPAQRAAKGPLPDPVLLDGSKMAAEKRPEYGMLGEFEMAGDEKAETDRVGGSSRQKGGSGSQQNAASTGEAGGGGAGTQATQNQQGGGQAIEQNAAQGSAEGTQVKEMQGSAQGGQAGQSGEKPQQVALGDAAMQIKPQANSQTVVGAQQQPVGKEVPQQYDKNTPGGKQAPSRGNQGVEKGRVMPAGI